MMRKSLFLAGLLVLPASAWAGELRDLCPDRPGKATPACILDPGHVEYEASIADWAHDRSGGAVDDGLLIGDSLLRIGLTTATEVQIGWTAWGQDRTRDASGVSKSSGTGDVTISIRHSLQNPDGKGVSIAVQPFVSLPVGGSAIGAGDWGAGLTIPASFELLRNLQFAVVPTIEAAVDEDRNGRHLAYSVVTALTVPVGDSGLSGTFELWGQRDNDPGGHKSEYSLDAVAAWQPKQLANVQLDFGTYLGLNHNTPDVELLGGVAIRF